MAHQRGPEFRPRPPHALFVARAGAPEVSKQALSYIAGVAPLLANRGVRIDIERVRNSDLRNQAVLTAFRARGIDRLPALLAEGRAYVGVRAIQIFYESLLPAVQGSQDPRGLPPAWRGSQPPREPRERPFQPVADGDPLGGREPATDGGGDSDDEIGDLLDNFFRQEMRVGRLGGEVDVSAELGDGEERRV